jgi:hypothetical protein
MNVCENVLGEEKESGGETRAAKQFHDPSGLPILRCVAYTELDLSAVPAASQSPKTWVTVQNEFVVFPDGYVPDSRQY